MTEATLTERIVRREQAIIAFGLVIITALAWYYLLIGAGTGMSTIAMTTWQFPPPRPDIPMTGAWSAAYWVTMLLMWWVMMMPAAKSNSINAQQQRTQ